MKSKLQEPVNLAEGLNKDKAELIKHFCDMKFTKKSFGIVQKKGSRSWTLYVTGPVGFDTNINEVQEFVGDFL